MTWGGGKEGASIKLPNKCAGHSLCTATRVFTISPTSCQNACITRLLQKRARLWLELRPAREHCTYGHAWPACGACDTGLATHHTGCSVEHMKPSFIHPSKEAQA